MWLLILSDQLLFVALVSHYLTNKLIRRGPILQRYNLSPKRAYPVLAQVSLGYSELKGTFPRVTHPSATDPRKGPFDLHVLGLPPAFVLSQDQTLTFREVHPDANHY